MERPTKTCAVCGRRIEWRTKWAQDWDSRRHCSEGCRRHGSRQDDRRLETSIMELLDRGARSPRARTISPSEAARAVGGAAWQVLVEPARHAAQRLVVTGDVVITQGGRVVDPSTATGPIRIRKAGRYQPSRNGLPNT
ncbi:MAG: DUF3253 domain-containing protein [Ilumatobacteraceae bacterium]